MNVTRVYWSVQQPNNSLKLLRQNALLHHVIRFGFLEIN